MTRPVGYYVHHQGAGHLHRARLVAASLRRPCTLIGTFAGTSATGGGATLLDLPDDRLAGDFDGHDGAGSRPQGLHYAPLGHRGVRARMVRIARWVEEADPVLFVIDVSVEVALLARLLSVPTLIVRLSGLRDDLPHLEAFRSAERLLAPFPASLEDPGTPDWVRAKTHYAGILADPSPRDATAPSDDVVVLLGRGGAGPGGAALAAAARAVPDRRWRILGDVRGGVADAPPNLALEGWVDDVPARLAGAGLVVGAAGDGGVAAAAAAGRPFLCLPEPRPYGEQEGKAAGLARLGAALVHRGWPDAADWPRLVAATAALDPAPLAALAVPGAVPRLAAEIDAAADAIEARERQNSLW